MRRTLVPALMVALMAAGCGGGDSEAGEPDEATGASNGEQAGQSAGGGDVVDPQPPGQAKVSVDGRDFTLTEPGGLVCSISSDSVTFSFRIGDNEVTLGGGLNKYDEGWTGSINLVVANPEGEDGPISYFPALVETGSIPVVEVVAVDGASMSYSGPMLKQPANDGSNPEPVEVGDGVFSVTCP